ncbi:MAG: hypothetical protein HC811_02045 [Flammeovirgaceae bacterium]|nr:hypothetical protein [Flammeovirgaceae bacterium]
MQAKIEGVINEFGRFLAGLFIFLFALIPVFNIVWIPAIIVLLVVAYVLIINNLYKGYKNKIREKLETRDTSQERLEVGYTQVTHHLEDLLVSQNSSRAVFSFKLLEK